MEQLIKDILADAAQPTDPTELLAIVDEHPAFVFLSAMLLRQSSASLPPERLDQLRAAVALGSADRQAMLDLADMAGFDWYHFYPRPKAPEKKTTVDTIDDFIAAYGHSSPEEDRLIEKLIFNPVAPDYFQGLDQPLDPADPLALPPELAAEPQQNTETAAAEPAEHHAETAPEAPESPLLMESLAKIFIKQRRYERALEIISKLSLNNPEKSVYFADQIRFLQKLLYIDRKKNNK